LLRRAGRAALSREAPSAELSITLLDDAAIAEMNQRWLDHMGPTDVISFPLYEPGEDVVGDVYIGYDQVVRQARENDVPVREELARVVVHGALHVLGHEHPDGRARLRSAMWRLQERIVAQVVT
ncbi:MAG: rRNA maturation RNase YbeY, partial [Longimicrobiales bacterium]